MQQDGESALPLAGVRVIELVVWVAGSASGKLLADWRACAIRDS